MEDQSASVGELRVVILSRSAELSGVARKGLCAESLRCIRVASAYEAAAELLAAPAVAMIVDLRLITGEHVRLIELAREMEVAILAVGALPVGMNADDLSGVRLTSREHLPEALGEIVQAAASPVTPPESSAPPGLQTAPREAVALTPAKPADRPKTPPDELLTPEELSALLENEP